MISLETSISLGAVAAGAIMLTAHQLSADNDRGLILEGDQLEAFSNAANKYVLSKATTLNASADAGPIFISADDLKAEAYLPDSFTNLSMGGHQFGAVVRKVSENRFKFISFLYGGATFSDSDLSTLAVSMGAYGGGVYSSDNGNFRANGGFVVEDMTQFAGAATVISEGYPGIYGTVGESEIATAYLRRDAVPGAPEANTMEADLSGGGHKIVEIAEVLPTGTVAGEGLDVDSMGTLHGLHTTHPAGLAAVDETGSTLVLRDASGAITASAAVSDNQLATLGQVRAMQGGAGSCENGASPGETCTNDLIFVGHTATGRDLFISQNIPIFSVLGNAASANIRPTSPGNLGDAFQCRGTSYANFNFLACHDGLMQSNYLSGQFSASIERYCRTLTTDGYRDWYVPSLSEAVSLMTYYKATDQMAALTPDSSSYRTMLSSSYDYPGSSSSSYRISVVATDPVLHTGIVMLNTNTSATKNDTYNWTCVRSE